jgi:hypothetical protein
MKRHTTKAILEGERDPQALVALVMPGVKAAPEDIAKSLEGNWREELLCDLQLRKHLESLGSKVEGQSHRGRRAKTSRGMLPHSTCAASYTALPALTGHKSFQ